MKNKTIKYTTTLTILSITLLGIIVGIFWAGKAHYGLILGLFLTLSVGYRGGYTLKELIKMMESGVKKAMIVLVIMGLIGMLSALWMKSGTIPAMMLLGFQYLTKMNFLLATFLITSVISLVLGTSIGTMTTIGIPLMEIGNAIGSPLPAVAGAIISGAYIGDRTSPMSSSANLTAAVTETKLMDMIKEMLKTLLPVGIICIVAYYLLGNAYAVNGEVYQRVEEIKHLMNSYFTIQWYSLIPPLAIILLALFKVPILYCLMTGLMSSMVLVLYSQNVGIVELMEVMVKGYIATNIQVAELLSGGGLVSMKNVLIIITASTALNGLMESMGMLEPLMKNFLKGIKNSGHLIYKTATLSIMISAATCNQSLAIIIPSRFLREEYIKREIATEKLGRTIGDSGVVSVGLIPWNVNAIAITSILGVPTLQYLPYAFLCVLLPIVTVIYGFIETIKESKGIEKIEERT
ncbi:Na+/H+ antiporter NhaC family protein [Alkaliphilus transvaalensis]|uniref:Na+/H+ antiporter NhaC family protein n=1 Tax=Alkaliphilus transvaalensis TaxID=114628 RepID=UPI000479A981|nr:Na+/H+ antiporter NhaC family protein [Alkaliphilus transvaalensis]